MTICFPVCKDKLDLVFVLDSSGSVSQSDFQLMLNFTADVVDAMDVSDDGVKVADIVYSSSAQMEFSFADYSTKAEVKTNLLSTYKRKLRQHSFHSLSSLTLDDENG